MLIRMASTGTDRMPPLASSVVDADAVKLISDWVTQDLPATEWYDAWAARVIGNGANAARDADPDGDGISNYAEYLMGTDPVTSSSPGSIDLTGLLRIHQPANRGVVIESTDGLPPNGWSVLDAPLKFPAVGVDLGIPAPFGPPQRYFRFRVVEP
jgi:hypothetical protein